VSQLLPDEIGHLGDAPYTLHRAIVDGLRALSYEEFPIDERPPRRIWSDGDRLRDWWAQVEVARQEKYGLTTTTDTDYDENALELIARG
jgi:hypothetical protein